MTIKSKRSLWFLFGIILFSGLGISTCQVNTQTRESTQPVKSTGFPPKTAVTSQTNQPVTQTSTVEVANTPTKQITRVVVRPDRTATIEPQGCQEPVDDYSVVTVNGWLLNRRTYLMLQHAAEIYGGEIEIAGYAMTQGSFNDNGPASFGTHLGGGAVDLSVMRKGTYTILYAEIPKLINALRTAGFAAWFRELNELSPGSPAHIHAIAIGDKQLSQAAREQLFGKAGYFRGFSGIPVTSGYPTPDRFGGPFLCQWMKEAGYQDLSSRK